MRFDSRGLVSTYISQWMPLGDTTRQAPGGYVVGGSDASVKYDRIDKLAFPTDTKTTLTAVLTALTQTSVGFANSGIAGYAAGGIDSTYTNRIDKITFPADTKSTLSATLTTARDGMGGFANSGVAGFSCGGRDVSGNVDGIDKITFPADTKSTSAAVVTTGGINTGGCANSGVAGYINKLYDVTGISKLTFSSETMSTISGVLSNARQSAYAFADSGVAGYWCGGSNVGTGTFFSTVDKVVFATDTASALGTGIDLTLRSGICFANIGVAGYYCGGFNNSVQYVDDINRFALPTDTRTVLSNLLTSGIANGAGFADCGVF